MLGTTTPTPADAGLNLDDKGYGIIMLMTAPTS